MVWCGVSRFTGKGEKAEWFTLYRRQVNKCAGGVVLFPTSNPVSYDPRCSHQPSPQRRTLTLLKKSKTLY